MSISRLALISAAAMFAASAHAATATSSFNVQLTVKSSCAITSASIATMDFGTQADSGTNLQNSAPSISVLCTKKTPYDIGLLSQNLSSNTSGGGSMKGAISGNTDTIAYQLHQASVTGANWGNVVGTNTLHSAGSPDGITAQSYTVYGVVPTYTNVLPDVYTDKVTVTVTY